MHISLTFILQIATLLHYLHRKHYNTEILLDHQQVTTTRSNVITKPFESSTLPYPQSWWNYNKLSTNNITDVIEVFVKKYNKYCFFEKYKKFKY